MCSGRPESLLQCHDAVSNSIVVYPFKNNLYIFSIVIVEENYS